MRDLEALAFEGEGLGDHRHGQDAEFACDFRDDRRGARARAAAHARGEEQHVRTLDHLDDALTILQRRLTADFRIGAGAETLRHARAELQRTGRPVPLERLRIGVHADELDALDTPLDHVIDGIAAAPAHTDHLDDRFLGLRIYDLEHVYRLL